MTMSLLPGLCGHRNPSEELLFKHFLWKSVTEYCSEQLVFWLIHSASSLEKTYLHNPMCSDDNHMVLSPDHHDWYGPC